MSIKDCLAAAVKAGTLSEKGAAEYATRMADAEALATQRGLAGPEAYIFATTEAAKAMEKRATNTRAQVQQTILAVDRAWEGAKANTRGTGYGLTTVLGERVAGNETGPSIGLQHRGNLATIQSIMSDFLSQVQSRMAGLKQNAVLPRHVVSELYGRATTTKEAAPAAKAWDRAMEWWMDGMRRAGVPVGELKDWRLPQHFDSAAVKALGPDGFAGRMETWWREGKLALRDWAADGQAMLTPGKDDDRVREIFATAYGNITTGGDASIEPGAVRGYTLADRYGRRRAFEWTSDEAWLEFNRTLGVGDDAIGELMTRHMDNISRDLAVAQTLGPDPDRAARTLIQMYQKEGGGRFWANKLGAIYEISSGKAMAPVSQRIALGAQSFRQFLSGVQLGSAILSSASDFGFTGATASWHGLDMSRVMADYVSRLGPGTREGRAEAMRSGLILEVGLRGLHDAARDTIGDVIGRQGVGGKADAALNGLSQATGRLAEVVIRAQGLAHHTQILRDAIGAQMQAHLGDLAALPWERLGKVDQRTFSTYGMGKAEWEILRAKAVDKGFLDPARLARDGEGAERDAAVKMLGAIAGVQRMAVPEGNAVTRALVLGATRPGTIEGEFLRGIAQYKGFPMAAFMQHYFRAMESLRDGEGQWFRGQYLASLMISTTVLGALSLQLKNIANGKDPEPMTGQHATKFWAQAFAQGGAGGIFGDQLKALFSAQRIGDASRLMTPTAGFMLDVQGLLQGNIQDSIAGRDPHAGREAVRFANKYTPDVWYTKLAMDRLVWDTLQKMVDPEAADTFSRIEERARKEQSTQFWWRPGSSNPRLPDLGRAIP